MSSEYNDLNQNRFISAINEEIQKMLEELETLLQVELNSGSSALYNKLNELLILRNLAKKLPLDKLLLKDKGLYIASTFFLHRCYFYLKEFDSEAVSYVSGPQINGAYLLDMLHAFKMSKRSWAMAAGDVRSTHNILQGLDRYGLKLSGYIHSHPGTGASSTRPSSVDLSLQEKFERAGYPTIGIIYSQDGYLRFFSKKRKFRVQLYGSQIEKVENNVFKFV
jgi:hypothetical protein